MRIKTLMAASALALTIAAPMAAQAATGLNGSYYKFDGYLSGVDNTLAKIATSSGPAATFTATNVCFPNCDTNGVGDGDTLSTFLGGNYTNLSSDFNGLQQHGLLLTGFLNIATAGSYTFRLGSDDGSRLYIDGNLAVNNDGDHGIQFVNNTLMLGAGSHAIKVVQYENGGGTGLSLTLNGAALGDNLSTTAGVPEPAAWALMLVGFGGLGAALRRRRAMAFAAA